MSSRTAVLGTRGGYGSLWAVHTEAERAAYLACRFSVERFGKYEILRELGRGAMGAVYQATRCSLGWLVGKPDRSFLRGFSLFQFPLLSGATVFMLGSGAELGGIGASENRWHS